MDEKIIQNAKGWGENSYFDESDRNEILNLLKDASKNETELMERFHRDLEFGTGGLRAPMGMGQNRMNKYNVRRATQALALTMKKHFGENCSAVVSYDSRNFSKEFALEAAGVFAANGIKARVFKVLTPTPMLSYAVRYYKAQGGIMITASHNPPVYNGYKAFWNDGAQVVPPVDKEIIDAYNSLTDWNEIKFMTFEEAEKKGLASWTDEKVEEAFYSMIEEVVIQDKKLCQEKGKNLSIIFTALHGTGEVPCATIAKRLGFTNYYSIPEQAKPDGNFSTVKSPNPEDPQALKMAVDKMISSKGDIVFGTDPDGDRLGLVVNHNNAPAYLNGNQIGALMIYYIFTRKQEMNKLPKNPLVIKSIVTSPLQNSIVESFGGRVEDTLTGFKWMAARIREHEERKSDQNFIFASEESFGYMPHKEARDKDGVSSLALMSEIALYFKEKGMTLVDALDEIYEKFGFYLESLVSKNYEGISGSQKIKKIMEYFRKYPETQFAGEEIVAKEDFLNSTETDFKLKKEKLIEQPKSDVLSFTFASGNKLFLRPSGTEPKIKFYTMVHSKEGDLAERKTNALAMIKRIETKILESCEKA
jgi:phosphoglucomutase